VTVGMAQGIRHFPGNLQRVVERHCCSHFSRSRSDSHSTYGMT
jgi:hypothetical protein